MSGGRDAPRVPGQRLLRWAEKYCARDVVESLVRPIIADLQFEDATGSSLRLARWFRCLRAYLALARALVVHAVTRETERTDPQSENSIKAFAVLAGLLAVLVSAMELLRVVFQDPHPTLFLATGIVLIALGVSRPVPRWLPRLVALWGFVIACGTLYLFRDSDQGTGSLILMPVFGAYAALSLSVGSIAILTGPAVAAGGLLLQLQGRPDHGILVAIGIMLTVCAIGHRSTRWRAAITKVTWPLKALSVALALVLLVSGNDGMAWDALIAYSSLSLLSGFGSSNPAVPRGDRLVT